MTNDSLVEVKFLVEFITSNLRKVISSRIKEHCVDKALCAVNSKRLTRADFLV